MIFTVNAAFLAAWFSARRLAFPAMHPFLGVGTAISEARRSRRRALIEATRRKSLFHSTIFLFNVAADFLFPRSGTFSL
jgi:hypothetical protein